MSFTMILYPGDIQATVNVPTERLPGHLFGPSNGFTILYLGFLTLLPATVVRFCLEKVF